MELESIDKISGERIEITGEETIVPGQKYEIHYNLKYVPGFLYSTIIRNIKNWSEAYFYKIHGIEANQEEKLLKVVLEKEKLPGIDENLYKEVTGHNNEILPAIEDQYFAQGVGINTVLNTALGLAGVLVVILSIKGIYKIVEIAKEKPFLTSLVMGGGIFLMIYSLYQKFFKGGKK